MSDILSKQNQNKASIQLIINFKGKLQKPFYFFKMSDAPYLACSLVGWNTTWFWVVEELVNSTAIIDHSNVLKPYMEVLIL